LEKDGMMEICKKVIQLLEPLTPYYICNLGYKYLSKSAKDKYFTLMIMDLSY